MKGDTALQILNYIENASRLPDNVNRPCLFVFVSTITKTLIMYYNYLPILHYGPHMYIQQFSSTNKLNVQLTFYTFFAQYDLALFALKTPTIIAYNIQTKTE